MKDLAISKQLSLPLDAVTEKLAFLGRTGSGKTYASMKLAELMLEKHAQVIALDPVGVWHGLRLGPEPFDVPVFGGLHGDVPLEPDSGKLIADVVFDRKLSVVLDVSQMVGRDPARFATAFAERLFYRQKSAPSALHVFIEECQEFIPQNLTKGLGQERMLHEFHRLIKIGRNFGIGVSLISQRPQEVSKKALNQTECMFAFQTTGPHERKAIDGWVADKGVDDDVAAILPKLEVGQAHVWSPRWLKFRGVVKIGKKRTADVSSTPKVGTHVRAVKLSPIELDQLRKDVAETIERSKADDPKELRRRIVELEREVAKKAPARAEAERVEVPVFDRKGVDEIQELCHQEFANVEGMLKTARSTIAGAIGDYRKRCANAAAHSERGVSQVSKSPIARAMPSRTNGAGNPDVGGGGLRRILIALAQRPQGLTPSQLGVRAQLSSRSGTFATYLARGRSSGWIEGSGLLRITDAGLKALGSYDPLPTGHGLLNYWLGELGQSGAARMLQALAEAYPKALSHSDIARRADLSESSGTFATYLSKLRRLELIEGSGELRASEELF
jgi:hypothetical protein